ncbi:MAG: hypothetical protein COX79_04930 [Candidatus Levybacteria bacterium CG_4_10_14_0_2_um_filter_36_16]|nr:MAG: hypothetical protein AUK12_00065 [Candidatus Levybacteria bacterium CG2_30_37_29]PIR78875.1 MAG: hypothetical protein COU26_04260 [Candidatus Levybacteria bacterium CG10_big_fil_rev_8_21_14_0_10_36_30]PIZ96539.1 MAG: hypothetical protein COX79_04930 [Candidatus Levybacteria bacterium CG_4_10_14_0_2_um_filter_36_16]
MLKHFYSYIVETESIEIELANLDLSEKEKEHLLRLVDSNINHSVVDTILSELCEEDKKEFLKHIKNKNQEKSWKMLYSKIQNAEEKIKKAAEDVKKEILEDIRALKKAK